MVIRVPAPILGRGHPEHGAAGAASRALARYLAALARAQGAQGFGPVEKIADLPGVFAKAIAAVEGGAVAVVDVRVEPGYTAAMTAVMTRKSE